jgi:hypothetical protein
MTTFACRHPRYRFLPSSPSFSCTRRLWLLQLLHTSVLTLRLMSSERRLLCRRRRRNTYLSSPFLLQYFCCSICAHTHTHTGARSPTPLFTSSPFAFLLCRHLMLSSYVYSNNDGLFLFYYTYCTIHTLKMTGNTHCSEAAADGPRDHNLSQLQGRDCFGGFLLQVDWQDELLQLRTVEEDGWV